jgi:hypothetical protein
MDATLFYSQVIIAPTDGTASVVNTPFVYTEKSAFCDGLEQAAISIMEARVNVEVYVSTLKLEDTITVLRKVRVK